MTIAYVTEQNASVAKEGERIVIKKEKKTLHTLHLFKLERLVLFGNVFLTPMAISALLNEGIDTVFMGKNGRYKGRLQGPHGKNIELRMLQFAKMSDQTFALATAKAVVEGKLANLRTMLLRVNRTRDDINLDNQILGIRQMRERIGASEDMENLRGLEGKGSAFYFEGFAKGFRREGIEFSKRVRRPPTDPVNALLSFGYTFLFQELLGAVNIAGLDPYLGTLHAVDYGRPSLPLDLMEEWRPVIIDSLVLSLFNLGTITLEDFIIRKDPPNGEEKENDGDVMTVYQDLPVKLTDAGRRKFIIQYERKMLQKVQHPLTGQQHTYRDCIREQVRHFVRYLKSEDAVYQPFPLK